MAGFRLHERLQADTVALADWPLCRILLMNDRRWPWLILVPARPGVREIHELSAPDRQVLIEEIAACGHRLEMLFRPEKVNVAALGNMVPQLHVHVIARSRTDAAWPGPVWGTPAVGYETAALEKMRAKLFDTLVAPKV